MCSPVDSAPPARFDRDDQTHADCGRRAVETPSQEDVLMATTITGPRLTRVAVHPASEAGTHYRAGREHGAIAPGFKAHPGLNLHYYGGRTIDHLTFTNVYLGGKTKWAADDVKNIDHGLSAALTDVALNRVLAQYATTGNVSATFKPSRFVDGPVPAHVYRDTIEAVVVHLVSSGTLESFPLESSVFNFMLPRNVVLVDGNSPGHAERHDDDDDDEAPRHNPALIHDEADDSKHGLGGYHGSVHVQKKTVYYAVGVYSQGSNGIVAFDKPWKNICAVFYHEVCETRTDPDVEDAIRAGDTPAADKFLGWYSPKGGEIGDIPLDEAGPDISGVMKEVPLANGHGTVPVQLMWSNAVGGPEGPIAKKHKPATR
jgi:hypothetical protein